jgi:hypothetical protein
MEASLEIIFGCAMPETTPANPEPKTPDQELADLVVAELKKAGLITERKVHEITSKVATGTARQDDWLVWIEQAIDQKAKEPAHGEA